MATVRFNRSHCEGVALVAVAADEVWVDLEQARAMHDALDEVEIRRRAR